MRILLIKKIIDKFFIFTYLIKTRYFNLVGRFF